MKKLWPHTRGNDLIIVVILATLALVVGWRVLTLVKTTGGAPAAGELPAAVAGADYLVYSTSRVTDRGAEEWANDDLLEYDFYRYALAGGGSEIIARSVMDNAKGYGSPWMRPLSPDTLLYVRRHSGTDDYVWIDATGRELPLPAAPGGSGIDGLPSPDGRRVAYVDPGRNRVSVLTAGSVLQTFVVDSPVDIGFWSPLAWTPDGDRLYLQPIFEGGDYISGLAVIDLESGEVSEIEAFRKLGLEEVSIDAGLGFGVGVVFRGDVDYGPVSGPSQVYLVDLETGSARELLSHESLAYFGPRLSPDGRRLSYSFDGDPPDVWLLDVDSGASRLLISGQVLAWTPDSRSLVVSRDNEVQVVDADSRAITTIARSRGKYFDPDFQGVEFIGIIKGK